MDNLAIFLLGREFFFLHACIIRHPLGEVADELAPDGNVEEPLRAARVADLGRTMTLVAIDDSVRPQWGRNIALLTSCEVDLVEILGILGRNGRKQLSIYV